MNRLDTPILLGLVLAPLLHGLFTPFVKTDVDARRAAIGTAVATLAVALAVAWVFFTGAPEQLLVDPITLGLGRDAAPILGVDALSAPLLPLVAGATVVVLLARPRGELHRARVRAILWTEATLFGLFLALDLAMLSFFWIATLAPLFASASASRDRQLKRAIGVYQGIGVVALLGATALFAMSGMDAGIPQFLAIREIEAHGIHESLAAPVTALLAMAVIARSGVVPMQGFVLTLFERAPAGLSTLLWIGQPGAYLVARLLLPVLPEVGPRGLVVLADIGLATGLFGALLGLAQHDLERIIGALAASQSGLLLVGLASTNAEGVAGGLVYWISSGLAVSGLALLAGMVKARTGTTALGKLGGLSRTMPLAAASFLTFGVAAIGLPGTLAFIGEDLLVHGVLESYPWVAAAMVIASMLNAISVFRAWFLGFVGGSRRGAVRVPEGRDLTVRERAAVLALVLTLVGLGISPRGLVHARDVAAEHTLESERHGAVDQR